MQLTISSDDPIDRVLAAVGALLGVELTVVEQPDQGPQIASLDDSDTITRPRPT